MRFRCAGLAMLAVRSYNDTMQSYNEARTDLTRVQHRVEAIAGRGVEETAR